MRIEGKKPSSLADLVAGMDAAENEGMGQIHPVSPEPEKIVEFGDGSVPVHMPDLQVPEPAPTPEPVITPMFAARARRKKVENAEVQRQDAPASEMPQIEKGVAVPDHGNAGRVKYPFKDMDVLDSFVVKQEPGETRKRLSARVRSAAAQYARRAKPKVAFTTRMESGGIRVWRMS